MAPDLENLKRTFDGTHEWLSHMNHCFQKKNPHSTVPFWTITAILSAVHGTHWTKINGNPSILRSRDFFIPIFFLGACTVRLKCVRFLWPFHLPSNLICLLCFIFQLAPIRQYVNKLADVCDRQLFHTSTGGISNYINMLVRYFMNSRISRITRNITSIYFWALGCLKCKYIGSHFLSLIHISEPTRPY